MRRGGVEVSKDKIGSKYERFDYEMARIIELAKREIIKGWNSYCGHPEYGEIPTGNDITRRWVRTKEANAKTEMIVWEGTPDKGMIVINWDTGEVNAHQPHTGGRDKEGKYKPILTVTIPRLE
jgi:hypothetical protein